MVNLGLGDVIAMAQLAFTVYERVKDAGRDYDRLASEGRNLHNILNRISTTWKRQSDRGFALSADDIGELHQYVSGCRAVLTTTNDFFLTIPRGTRTMDEIKFRAKMVIIKEEVVQLQEELRWYKNNLIELHNLIFQNEILERLASGGTLAPDEQRSMQRARIRDSIRSEGRSASIARLGRPQGQVPADDLQKLSLGKNTNDGVDEPSSPLQRKRTWSNKDDKLERESSHQDILRLSRKLLQLDPTNSKQLEEIQLYSRAIWKELYTIRDANPNHDLVIQYCSGALADCGYELSLESVGSIVRSIDTNSDAMVDEAEFKELVAGMFVIIRDLRRMTLRQIEHESAEVGAKWATLEHAAFLESDDFKTYIPWGWRDQQGVQFPVHINSRVVCNPDWPPVMVETLTLAADLALDNCAVYLKSIQERWSGHLKSIGGDAALYRKPLEQVSTAVQHFAFLQTASGKQQITQEDMLLYQANLTAWNHELTDSECPLETLVNARSECFRVLRLILGWIYDLLTEARKAALETAFNKTKSLQVLNEVDSHDEIRLAKPPDIATWLARRMIERADSIARETAAWSMMKAKFAEASVFIRRHQHFEDIAQQALERSAQVLGSAPSKAPELRGPSLKINDFEWNYNTQKEPKGASTPSYPLKNCLHLRVGLVPDSSGKWSDTMGSRTDELWYEHHVSNISWNKGYVSTPTKYFDWKIPLDGKSLDPTKWFYIEAMLCRNKDPNKHNLDDENVMLCATKNMKADTATLTKWAAKDKHEFYFTHRHRNRNTPYSGSALLKYRAAYLPGSSTSVPTGPQKYPSGQSVVRAANAADTTSLYNYKHKIIAPNGIEVEYRSKSANPTDVIRPEYSNTATTTWLFDLPPTKEALITHFQEANLPLPWGYEREKVGDKTWYHHIKTGVRSTDFPVVSWTRIPTVGGVELAEMDGTGVTTALSPVSTGTRVETVSQPSELERSVSGSIIDTELSGSTLDALSNAGSRTTPKRNSSEPARLGDWLIEL